MTGCPPTRIEGVSREVWSCLWRRAREMSLPAQEASSGSLRHGEGAAEWSWDEAAGVLTVTVTRRPPDLDCAWVERRLRETARGCGAGTAAQVPA
ncbi:MAG TPA: hypothetical protein VHG51_20130 [Longimicrobiaceae bacterium]|nr:hypothetical protein [Longimicrobiaceae bacterium]